MLQYLQKNILKLNLKRSYLLLNFEWVYLSLNGRWGLLGNGSRLEPRKRNKETKEDRGNGDAFCYDDTRNQRSY